MKNKALLLLILLLGCSYASKAVLNAGVPMQLDTAILTLRNLQIVDVSRGVIISGKEIVIKEGMIFKIRRQRQNLPDGVLVDLKGAFIMPGLIDGHVHVTARTKNNMATTYKLLIGKDFRTKRIGMLNLTTMNGLVDEISLWDKPINRKLMMKDIAGNSAKTPRLAIPVSRFEHDFSRPKYHLLPAANWTNETHGLIFYKGKYHIFNQKNASGLALRQINWGHFSSSDLIHWTEHKPALSPEKGYDENGIWSGHVLLDDNGKPVISYTAGGPKMGIALAYPKDSLLIEWEKYKYNPVIPGQPDGYSRTDLRDTYVWKEGKKWYMVVGFGIEEHSRQKGALLLYSSDNLQRWKFLHTLFEGDPDKDGSGIFWEMPVFKKNREQIYFAGE